MAQRVGLLRRDAARYYVVDVDGEKIEWHYHPCGNQLGVSNGLGDDYQMRVYSPSDYGDGYVYANVWAWDALWGSVLYTDNGPNAVAGRPMARIEDYDKAYKECCDRSNSKPGNLAKEEFKPDTNVKHLFRIKPSDGATSCTVEVTDRFRPPLLRFARLGIPRQRRIWPCKSQKLLNLYNANEENHSVIVRLDVAVGRDDYGRGHIFGQGIGGVRNRGQCRRGYYPMGRPRGG